MDVTALLVALCYIAIVCVIFQVIIKLSAPAEPVPTVLWAVCVIICIALLIAALTGHGPTYPFR